jgi:hypothetical protein
MCEWVELPEARAPTPQRTPSMGEAGPPGTRARFARSH